jgi:TolB-like protein
MSLFNELKRRNVIRVGIAYVVVSWLTLQVADVILNNIEAPGWVFHAILLLFAWAFELTPEGIKREFEVDRSQSVTPQTGKKLDRLIIGVLVFALGYFAFDKFVLSVDRDAALIEATTQTVTEQVAGESAASMPSEKSIAVLPFINLSSDPEQDFFSDGISEELLNVLAQLPGLRVAARTSSFFYKGKLETITLAEIAQQLDVAHILEGSVRKSANKLRITAQLIKADDGFHLWSKTYDRELTDIFVIQDEISAAIGDALKVQLALADESLGNERPMVIETANTQAYEAYLRGRQLINQRGRDNIENAVQLLEKSLRLDSEYAPAHAQLAIGTALLLRSPSSYGDLTLAEVLLRATPHIEKALALAPDLAEAHGALALMTLNQQDFSAVMGHTARALQLNPSYIDAMNWQWLAVSALGDYQQVEAVMQRLLSADPLSIVGRLNYINILGAKRGFDKAHAIADELVTQYPWAGFVAHGQTALDFEGELATGLHWYLQAFAADPTDTFSNVALVSALNYAELYAEARRVDDDLLFRVSLAEGLESEAIALARRRMELDAKSPSVALEYADTLHRAGHIAEAQALYEEQFAKLLGRPLRDPIYSSATPTLRMALGRRQAGDEEGFGLLVQLIEKELEAIAAANLGDQFVARTTAMLAALQGDPASALESIRTAINLGLRDPRFFDEPVFASVKDEPEFQALQAQLNAMVQTERGKILQLICHNNPVPESWQPLAETCAGVDKTS